MPSSTPRKRVIVIGAGFAGINVVKKLSSTNLDITLVDKHNYHLFQPLLYQVATAALSPADIAYPIRRIFRKQQNVHVVLGEVERIDVAKNEIGGGEVTVKYDYLVIAVGSTHSYFNHPDWHSTAPGLKTIDDATEIRRRLLLAFEEAELENNEAARRAKLTFVVVGGGPTGVEMAGAMREIAAQDIQRDFRNIDTKTTRVILLQGGDRLIPTFPESLSERAGKDLESMGVEVRLNAHVTKVDEDGVWIGDEQVHARTVIWAAGVEAPKVLQTVDAPKNRSGQIKVGPDLTVPGHPNTFVIGDAAEVVDANGVRAPGLAPAAMQMGKYVARIIRDEVESNVPVEKRPPFKYWDKGTMATIGKRRAVADIKGFKYAGLLAWLTWSLVHIMFLIGFRTKIFVMATWIFDYLFHNREARLITGNFKLRVNQPRGIATDDQEDAAKAERPGMQAAGVE